MPVAAGAEVEMMTKAQTMLVVWAVGFLLCLGGWACMWRWEPHPVRQDWLMVALLLTCCALWPVVGSVLVVVVVGALVLDASSRRGKM